MGLIDRLKDLTKRATDTAAEHKDQIHQAVENAEVLADQRTGGKYHNQIDKARTKAEAYVDKLEPSGSEQTDQPPATTPDSRPKPAE